MKQVLVPMVSVDIDGRHSHSLNMESGHASSIHIENRHANYTDIESGYTYLVQYVRGTNVNLATILSFVILLPTVYYIMKVRFICSCYHECV